MSGLQIVGARLMRAVSSEWSLLCWREVFTGREGREEAELVCPREWTGKKAVLGSQPQQVRKGASYDKG